MGLAKPFLLIKKYENTEPSFVSFAKIHFIIFVVQSRILTFFLEKHHPVT
jgi:hypothetical protein